MESENVALRLKLLIERLGVTSSSFADKCGISRATLSQMLTGRNKKISDVILSQIHAAYPSISIMWLLFGEGSEWIASDNGPTTDNDSSTIEERITSEKIENIEPSHDSENQICPDGKPCDNFQTNFNAVNLSEKATYTSDIHDVNDYQKTIRILSEIEKNSQKQRKVTQITIYYDDSTYETLYPQR